MVTIAFLVWLCTILISEAFSKPCTKAAIISIGCMLIIVALAG